MCWAPHAPTYTNACICRAYACPCTLLLPTCVTATHPYPFHFAQNTKLHFKLDSILNTSSSSMRIPVVRNYCSLCEQGEQNKVAADLQEWAQSGGKRIQNTRGLRYHPIPILFTHMHIHRDGYLHTHYTGIHMCKHHFFHHTILMASR